jgi:ParB/RepB/Spo0J family partition protein
MRDMADYELVAGERRWRAAQIAGLEHVPAIVRDLDDNQVLRAQLTENIQRADAHRARGGRGLSRAHRGLEKTNVDGIVPIVGKSRSWIYDRLKLLDLIPDARQALLEGKLDPYLALPVARTSNKKLQAKAFAIAMKPGMTVRELKSRLTGPGFTAHLHRRASRSPTRRSTRARRRVRKLPEPHGQRHRVRRRRRRSRRLHRRAVLRGEGSRPPDSPDGRRQGERQGHPHRPAALAIARRSRTSSSATSTSTWASRKASSRATTGKALPSRR